MAQFEPGKILYTNIDVPIKNNVHIGTTNYPWGALPDETYPVIDFAFLAGEGYRVDQYQHIVNMISATASDHIAISIDIELV